MPAAAPVPGQVVLTGTLVHEPIAPGVKSVAAYTGIAFFLTLEDGSREPLLPSDAVTEEALTALAGSRVELAGVREAGTAPDPMSQAPLGLDGAPLPQGAGLRVMTARAL